MQAKKDYENLPDDGELLYMISDNNDCPTNKLGKTRRQNSRP